MLEDCVVTQQGRLRECCTTVRPRTTDDSIRRMRLAPSNKQTNKQTKSKTKCEDATAPLCALFRPSCTHTSTVVETACTLHCVGAGCCSLFLSPSAAAAAAAAAAGPRVVVVVLLTLEDRPLY